MQGGTWDHHPNLKWLKRFKNDTERRNFVTCGAAAGVAAAFRAPVGGLLFALEQLTTNWSEQLLLTCFFTTAIVSITIRMIMRICNQGGCGFFGEGDAIIFHIAEQDAQVCSPPCRVPGNVYYHAWTSTVCVPTSCGQRASSRECMLLYLHVQRLLISAGDVQPASAPDKVTVSTCCTCVCCPRPEHRLGVVQQKYEIYELFPMLLVGIMGGLLGSLFNLLNKKANEWRKPYSQTIRGRLAIAAVVSVITATVTVVLPLFLSCRVWPSPCTPRSLPLIAASRLCMPLLQHPATARLISRSGMRPAMNALATNALCAQAANGVAACACVSWVLRLLRKPSCVLSMHMPRTSLLCDA